MRHRKNDPDRPLYLRARWWASLEAGVPLVLANEITEPGARWVRYYPEPFVALAVGAPLTGHGCFALLRPSRARRPRTLRHP